MTNNEQRKDAFSDELVRDVHVKLFKSGLYKMGNYQDLEERLDGIIINITTITMVSDWYNFGIDEEITELIAQAAERLIEARELAKIYGNPEDYEDDNIEADESNTNGE